MHGTVGSSPATLAHDPIEQSSTAVATESDGEEGVGNDTTQERDALVAENSQAAAGVSIGLSLLEGLIGSYSDSESGSDYGDEDTGVDSVSARRATFFAEHGTENGRHSVAESESSTAEAAGLGYARSEDDHTQTAPPPSPPAPPIPAPTRAPVPPPISLQAQGRVPFASSAARCALALARDVAHIARLPRTGCRTRVCALRARRAVRRAERALGALGHGQLVGGRHLRQLSLLACVDVCALRRWRGERAFIRARASGARALIRVLSGAGGGWRERVDSGARRLGGLVESGGEEEAVIDDSRYEQVRGGRQGGREGNGHVEG